MKCTTTKFLIIIALLLQACFLRAEEWRFAPLPMENPESIIAGWKPLLDHLSGQLGVTIRIDYSHSYEEILTKFAAGRLDLAYLGPLPYVELKKRLPDAQPLVHFKEKSGTAFYTCALVAAEPALSPQRIIDKKVALTQPLSTCGYLATHAMLQKYGGSLEKNRFRYLDKHDAVAQAVVRGEFDAGGLKTAIAEKYAALGLRILDESPSFPGFALVAHGGRIDAAQRRRIIQALQSADETLRRSFGESIRHGVAPADDADYAPVRRFLPAAPIPQQGNF